LSDAAVIERAAPAVEAAPELTNAQAYREIVREARRTQIRLDTEAVRKLETLLSNTAAEMRETIRNVPRGILSDRYRREMLASLDRVVQSFSDEYKLGLDAGISEMARAAEAREIALLEVSLKEQGIVFRKGAGLVDGLQASVRLGSIDRRVLQIVYNRLFSDGRNLYDRLYKLKTDLHDQISETVLDGIAKGESARNLAKRIAPILETDGVKNARLKAMTISRTEINTAYREAHRQSVIDEHGKLLPYVSAIGWRLSAAHPRICICDVFASDETDGLGPGNYFPDTLPTGHPRCLCFTVSIMTLFPEEQWVVKKAEPEEVPEGQLVYYGVKKG